MDVLGAARRRGVAIGGLEEAFAARRDAASRYDAAWRRYVWEVRGLNDLKLAPFHLLATEGMVHDGQDHACYMRQLAAICAHDTGVLLATAWREVALDDAAAIDDATTWWETLTLNGGEGVVMKPVTFVARGAKGLVQPAIKVRGREYLRLVCRPEYTLPGRLERLRDRGLGGKRALALCEFALGLEALHRFTAGEPLRCVHECAFGVLAIESEPINPRL